MEEALKEAVSAFVEEKTSVSFSENVFSCQTRLAPKCFATNDTIMRGIKGGKTKKKKEKTKHLSQHS